MYSDAVRILKSIKLVETGGISGLVSVFNLFVRFNLFTGCPEAKTCTLILRGGAEQFIEETERSLHDAIMIVRRTLKNDAVVAGKRGRQC